VSACTSRKKFAPLNQLTEADLDEPISRQHGEARLAGYRLPRAEMYTGTSHNFVIDAIKMLRDNGYSVSHFISSSGYGLLSESDLIVLYDVTFSGAPKAWIRERGRQLRLREQLVARAREHEQVILILGREYLTVIGLPLLVDSLPPIIIYIALKERRFQMDVYCTHHPRADHA
jgi:hypothetical protein